MAETCHKCQQPIHVGDWPFCPHGPVRYGVIRDEIPGGFRQEHFGHEPETFYSWSAMRKRADELGLQPFVRKLEQVNECAMIDAKTLDDKRVLLSRGSRAAAEDPVRLETFTGEIRDITNWNEVA